MTGDLKAGRREWLGLAVLALPTLLTSLDLSVLYLALPRIGADLRASSVEQLWITDMYGFMVAGFLVTMGTIGDRIGRRRLLMIGAVAFAIASLTAAFAHNPETLIGARALLGLAGATLAPSTLALISSMFKDPKQQAVAMAAWMSCFVAGNAIGPVIGGVLLHFFWWGSVFLLGVPVMVILLLAGPRLLPEFRAPQAGRVDVVSVALSLAAILPLVYGLKESARHGWQPVPLVAVVVGLVMAVLFAVRQRRLEHPLLDLRLFNNRSFSAVLTMMLVGGVFLGGATLLVTQFLQLVAGRSPLQAGLLLLPAIVVMTMASMAAPGMARKVRPAYIMAGGMAVAALGYLILTQVPADGGLPLLVVGWAVALGGSGLPAGLGMGLLFGTVPPEKAGSASSIQQTGTELGLALGIATVGSLATAVYRSTMDDKVPSTVPADVAEAARDNLATTVSKAQQFPDLIAAARDAYASGFHVGVWAAAAVTFGLAVMVAVVLRHVPAFGDQQAGPGAPPEQPTPDGAGDAAYSPGVPKATR